MATLVTKNSSTAAAVPGTGDLVQGELAINVTDKRLFTKNAGGSVVEVGTNPSSLVVTGDVGVGTSSPGAKLHVKVGTNQNLLTTSTSSKVTNLAVDDAGSGYVDWQQYANQFLWFTASTQRMALDTSGNLGLGVTPDAWQSGYRSYTMQYGGSLATTTGIVQLGQNYFYNASSQYIYRTPDFASFYRQQSGQHMWFTAPSGTAGNAITFTQAMTLDASANLGVGTTLPQTKAHISGASTTSARVSCTGGTGVNLDLTATSTEVQIGSPNGVALLFNTTNTERARITSAGDLLVGTVTNTNSYKTHIVTDGAGAAIGIFQNNPTTPYGINVYYGAAAPNNANANTSFLYCNDTSTVRIQLSSNGGVTNYQANNTNLSDRREKTNFSPAKSYLDTICAIPVQTFNYIDQNLEDDPGLTLGVVAQDVQAVAPELVMESNWGTEDNPKMRLSIYQTDLQYALMKCIQEQQALITDLRARVAALETA